MKKFRQTALICVLLIAAAMLLSGCGENDPLCGEWAYIHDPETPVLTLEANGKAKFNGADYTFKSDDTYIKLASGGETLDMRYVLEDDGMYLYETTVYTYASEGTPNGLTGRWECKAQNWTFEFTENGTFMEDAIFPGYYFADEAAGTIKLVYNDQFVDTVCYYTLSGNELRIEYPWRMVKAQ